MTERVALVSSERGFRVDPDLPLAVAALADAGHLVDLVRWDDGDVEWSGVDLAVVRSSWDYAWRLEEFFGWAASVPRLRIGAELLRWNTDETYLRDLGRAGLPVVPTVWEPVRPEDLPPAAERVVKPSVSAGSRDSARWTTRAAALTRAAVLTAAGRTAMAQPYQASVDDFGETAMLFIRGRFSHAVRKGPLLRRGEGVRQDRDSLSDLSRVHLTTAQRDVAQEVFEAIAALVPGAETPLYARIDLVHDEAGRVVVLELELTEPGLFLLQAPETAETLARAVVAEVQQ